MKCVCMFECAFVYVRERKYTQTNIAAQERSINFAKPFQTANYNCALVRVRISFVSPSLCVMCAWCVHLCHHSTLTHTHFTYTRTTTVAKHFREASSACFTLVNTVALANCALKPLPPPPSANCIASHLTKSMLPISTSSSGGIRAGVWWWYGSGPQGDRLSAPCEVLAWLVQHQIIRAKLNRLHLKWWVLYWVHISNDDAICFSTFVSGKRHTFKMPLKSSRAYVIDLCIMVCLIWSS